VRVQRASRRLVGVAALWALFPLAATIVPGRAFGQGELTRKVTTRVSPTYPELARRMSMRGTVKIVVVVSPNGSLKDAKVVGGNPILVNAALEAVKKWKFEPAPDESAGTVEFKFQPDRPVH
jgi:TonB family protein